MNNIDTTKVSEFWIVFEDGKNPFTGILKKGFQHCYVITRDKFSWIKIEPTNTTLDIQIFPVKREDNVPKLLKNQKPNRTIIGIQVLDRSRKSLRPNRCGLRTCTEIVKYICGLKIFCLTPYSLYRKLTQMSESSMQSKGIRYVNYVI